MKKEEFKNLIKESVKEALMEDTVLKETISEAVKELAPSLIAASIKEAPHIQPDAETTTQSFKKQQDNSAEVRTKMLEAIGRNSYNGVNLFEGTKPLRQGGDPSVASAPSSPLTDIEPADPGVDISALMGNKSVWKEIIK
jgi:hypothetical protein